MIPLYVVIFINKNKHHFYHLQFISFSSDTINIIFIIYYNLYHFYHIKFIFILFFNDIKHLNLLKLRVEQERAAFVRVSSCNKMK